MLHACELRRIRGASRVAEHCDPRLRLGEVAPEVDRDATLLKTAEILVDLVDRHGRTALAPDRRGDAHAQLVLRESIPGQHAPGLIHHVDEAGRHVQPGGVDLAAPLPCNSTDPDDAPRSDSDISPNPGVARPIQHTTTADNYVVPGRLLGREGEHARPRKRRERGRPREGRNAE